LARKGAKKAASDEASRASSVTVVKGTITTADDPTALDVKLSIWATEITMRADGSELGNWPTGAVVIRPIDAFNFEFIAEGDQLVFTPSNPEEFARLPVVAGGEGGSKRRRRSRSAKKKSSDQPPSLKWDETTDAEAQLRRKQADRGRSDRLSKEKEQTKQPKRTKPTRAERRAAKAAERTTGPSASEPGPDREEWIGQFGEVETPANSEPDAPRAAAPAAHSSVAIEPMPDKESLRHRALIGCIDFARRYDLFGLDRVQVTPEQRGDPNHSHTWNHRVAPTSGPGKYICTICGAFRRNT